MSLKKIIIRCVLGLAALVIMVEALCWAFFRAPEYPLKTIHLENNLPGIHPTSVVQIDDRNLRYFNWSEKRSPDTVKILVLGGDATLALLQSAPDTWWGQLHSMLSQGNPSTKFQIAAFGAQNGSSLVCAKWYDEFGADLKPDIVITNFGIEDIIGKPIKYQYDPKAYEKLSSPRLRRGGIKDLLPKFSQLGKWMRAWRRDSDGKQIEMQIGRPDFFADGIRREQYASPKCEDPKAKDVRRYPAMDSYIRLNDDDPLPEYLDALRIIQEIAAKQKATLIVTTQATLHDSWQNPASRLLHMVQRQEDVPVGMPALVGLPNPTWVESELSRYANAAEKQSIEGKNAFVNLNGQVPRTEEYFLDDILFTDKGAAEYAKQLAPHVADVLKKMGR